MDLKGKVVIVTGAGSGIGKATALRFAAAGAKVAVLSRTEDEIKKTAKEIERAGGEALAIAADISDAASIERAIAQAVEKFGRLDVVIANAGVNGVWAPIEEITPEEFDTTVAINLRGTFLTIKYAVPHLKKAGRGSIVIVSSINGTRTFSNTGATAYSTTKAGQLAMANMLALELARDKIRVNTICPGAIESEIGENTEQRDVEKVKIKVKYETQIPLNDNKPGKAEQVADLALFLASDASSHITGTPVWIDGGQSLLI